MNQKIQELVMALSENEKAKIVKYVKDNLGKEIEAATKVGGTLSEEMMKKKDELIVKYLEENYPNDLNHTLRQNKNEIENELSHEVLQSLDQISNSSQPHIKPGEYNTSMTLPSGYPSEPSLSQHPESNLDTNEYLGRNDDYEQVHDRTDRFFGLQEYLYKFLSKFEDDLTASYFRIVMVVIGIGVAFAIMHFYSETTGINHMNEYFQSKNQIYMQKIADFCTSQKLGTIQAFQSCVVDRQNELLKVRQIARVWDAVYIFGGLIILGIVYFLKLNYRGRDEYIDNV
ncbi:TPA: hypothetical protein ACGIK9_002913 [Acinetobacter baumannii]|uniref:hypothetical protein n=1 Tax=Acinetobacter baumannii TaxID=470 RepID=UPI00338FB128